MFATVIKFGRCPGLMISIRLSNTKTRTGAETKSEIETEMRIGESMILGVFDNNVFENGNLYLIGVTLKC
jgi:hypothetical protein